MGWEGMDWIRLALDKVQWAGEGGGGVVNWQ
jgi:hypothetical protein